MSADALDDNLDLQNTILTDVDDLDDLAEKRVKLDDSAKKDKIIRNSLPDLLSSHSNLVFNGRIQPRNLHHLLDKNILIISASAIKCTRILSNLVFLERKIGKLFAKHLKIQDQIQSLKQNLKKSETSLNVGTPNRLLKLSKFLDLERLDVIIIDMSLDVKKFSILDLKDTRRDLSTFLLGLQKQDIQVYELKDSFI